MKVRLAIVGAVLLITACGGGNSYEEAVKDAFGTVPNGAVTIQTSIGELQHDGFVLYPSTDEQCSKIRAADLKNEQGSEGEITKLVGIEPAEGMNDWGWVYFGNCP